MVEESNFFQIYHLKDMFLSAELLISCSVLQLTFYVTSISYTRKSGFIVLSQQIYYIGFLVFALSAVLLLNEDLLFQTFISVNDYLSFFSKLIVCLSSLFFIFIIKTSYKDELVKHNFEYVVLILIGTLGSFLLCSSNDLLTAYLAMELQSVAFYLMAAFKKNSNYSIESGLKYFIVGSFASALFLFGSSFLYGCTGSLKFDDFNIFFPFMFMLSVPYSDSDIVPFISTIIHYVYIPTYSVVDYALDVLSDGWTIFFTLSDDMLFDVRYVSSWLFEDDYFYSNLAVPYDFIVEETGLLFNNEESINSIFTDKFNQLHYVHSRVFGRDIISDDKLETFSLITQGHLFKELPDFSHVITDFPILSAITTEFNGSVYHGFFDVPPTSMNLDLIYVGFMLVCLSLLIKLAVAPFHYWSLDVYEGSPNQTTFFFAVVPKIGLFVLLIRLCYSGFYDFLINWQFYFLLLALVSIFVGSFGGLEQRKLKSLLAYSSISHTGYLLLSFSTNLTEGVQMTMYYIVIFMLSGLCFWSIYMFLRQKMRVNYYNKQNKELGDLILLRESNPILAIALVVTLFSIAGIPPLVGFLAKLGIFLSALSASTYIIALFSVLLSVISTFYYIRLIKIIFFENVLVGKLYHSISTNKSILISILFFSLILLCMFPMILYITSHKAILLL